MFLKKRKASGDEITSIKTLKKKCIKELKKSKLNIFFNNSPPPLCDSLMNCQNYILSFYTSPNNLYRDELLERLKLIEFSLNHRLNVISSIILGILASFATTILTKIVFEPVEWLPNVSNPNEFIKFASIFLIMLLIFFIFVGCPLILLIIRYGLSFIKEIFNDNYQIFVLPYEKEVILQVLESKYDLSLKPQKGSKMLK